MSRGYYKFILLSVFLISSLQLNAQAFSQIRDVNILTDERIVVQFDYPKRYDTIKIVSRDQVSPKQAKIGYIDKGVYCEAIVNTGRKDMLLVASAVAVPVEEMPDLIIDSFKRSEYGNWEIIRTLAMKTPYEPWFYAIDAKQGDKTRRVFYDELGTYKKPPY